MKSIKPGRGPSMMGAVGSVIAVIFGIAWIGVVDSMNAPSFFILFGVLFVIMGIVNVVYNLTNATNKNRFSIYDFVDSKEERDPLDKYSKKESNIKHNNSQQGLFCPYCGNRNEEDFDYCVKCGRELPELND
ncbi:MAG: zinc ribbon domain-containing protein [Halanaerobiales bacterium]